MGYQATIERVRRGDVVLLDGGVGTELERRGAAMDPNAWCGPATIGNVEILEGIHRDYIAAGAEIITANTYGSAPIMLEHAGFGDHFEVIVRTAVAAAHAARRDSAQGDVLVAGSMSHMVPRPRGEARSDRSPTPETSAVLASSKRLGTALREAGCDLILVEMMYHPDRMRPVLEAAMHSQLPVWVGIAARQRDDGRVLSHASHRDIPLEQILPILNDFDIDAAGIMHTASSTVGDALDVLSTTFNGPLMAYPDSGYFTMPNWNFENIIPPAEFAEFARRWVDSGVRIVGGCCGLGPEHIEAIKPLAGPR